MPDSFWANAFGRPTARQPAAPPPAAWWQDPAPQPFPQPQAPAGPVPLNQYSQLTSEQIARVATQEGHDVSRAQHFRHEDNCPSCGGGDYMSPPASPNGRKRCFDCGYPIVQQGSGITITEAGRGTPARQVAAGGKVIHNYHPTSIQDRIA